MFAIIGNYNVPAFHIQIFAFPLHTRYNFPACIPTCSHTLHTSHFTLHASNFTLHTSHFTLHTSHFTLHILHTSHFEHTSNTLNHFTRHTSNTHTHTHAHRPEARINHAQAAVLAAGGEQRTVRRPLHVKDGVRVTAANAGEEGRGEEERERERDKREKVRMNRGEKMGR